MYYNFCVWLFLNAYVLIYLCLLQAGDLYEKVHRNDEALQCYKKGYAYRRGNVVHCMYPVYGLTCLLCWMLPVTSICCH